jgi:hypothetical protein
MPRDYYPCGACEAYIPLAVGCPHWKPRVVKSSKEPTKLKYAYEPWMNVLERQRFRQRTIKQRKRDQAKAQRESLTCDPSLA